MNILFTGKGNMGSWQIRGIQLGTALGATIKPMATLADCQAADLIVVVKRVPALLLKNVLDSGKPWVLDIVDGWPQPCYWNADLSLQWLREWLGYLKPAGIVYGTARMMDDAANEAPHLVLPHHSWSRYADVEPIFRQQVRTLGYEGNPQYLGRWHDVLIQQCQRRGLDFIMNGSMRLADVGIALRDGGGYPARWWKPGTKLSNLHALGIPALCSLEEGAEGVASGAEFWIEQERDIEEALDRLQDNEYRRTVCEKMRSSLIRLEDLAPHYLKWLESLL